MRNLILTFFLLISNITFSQELYINSEPASLIPKGSKVVRLKYSNIKRSESLFYNIIKPSISYGISKNIMISAMFQFSNEYSFNGFSIYSKQRIFSSDRQKYHSRFSSYFRGSYHDKKYLINSLDLEFQDTGFEFGFIGTQLINKLAVSLTSGLGIYTKQKLNSLQNTLSIGYLLLPRSYKSYKQTNFNLYFEVMTNAILDKVIPRTLSKFSSTLAPGIQLIFFSRSRLDFSYRIRKATNSNDFLIKLSYIIY